MEATIAIEPSTRTPVDLKGLSPNEVLYCLMAEHCDRKTFNAADGAQCLMGQTAYALGSRMQHSVVDRCEASAYRFMSRRTGADEELCEAIFELAAVYGRDLDGALAMAREKLGIGD